MNNKIKILMSGEGREEQFVEIHAGATDREIIEAFHKVATPTGSVEEYKLFFEKIEGDEVEIVEEEVRVIREHTRIHCHRCEQVSVSVSYQDLTEVLHVSPDETVAELTKTAAGKFTIQPADAASLVLKLEGKDLPVNDSIGKHVVAPHCSIAVVLSPSPKFLG